jgi:hypothetical protein
MDDMTINEIAQDITSLESPAQFARCLDLDLSENQLDQIFGQLLNDREKNLWPLRGLAANPRISLTSLEQCLYSPIGTHFFAIQNPRLDQLKESRELPIHQIESVRNALGQREIYQQLLNESISADTSPERFAELAAMNLTSAAYIAFRHDRESVEAILEDLFTKSASDQVDFSETVEATLQEFVEYQLSPEYPELLWRVQANRMCDKFQEGAITYWDLDYLSFENLNDLLDMLPARLAFVVAGERDNYDESWPMAQVDESPFELDIENALRMAHPSTPDSIRIAIINKLIPDVIYDSSEIAMNYIGQESESFMMMDLDSNDNWITLLSAILYTQDTELLESIAQGDNDLWKLAVILNPSATPEIVQLANDFEGDFSLEYLPEVDFFEEMVVCAIRTHDLDAANHWQGLAGVSDNQNAEDEDLEDEDDDFEDE